VQETKASGTAYLISASLAVSGRDPLLSQIVPSQTVALSEWVIEDTLPNGRLLLWASEAGGPGFVRIVERIVLPGIQAHYIVRKRL